MLASIVRITRGTLMLWHPVVAAVLDPIMDYAIVVVLRCGHLRTLAIVGTKVEEAFNKKKKRSDKLVFLKRRCAEPLGTHRQGYPRARKVQFDISLEALRRSSSRNTTPVADSMNPTMPCAKMLATLTYLTEPR